MTRRSRQSGKIKISIMTSKMAAANVSLKIQTTENQTLKITHVMATKKLKRKDRETQKML